MLPAVFGENLFDDFFDDAFLAPVFHTRNPLYGKNAAHIMKTDIREKDGSYELDVDLPGFKKDEVQLNLENGYLTISAEKSLNRDEKEEGKEKDEGRYLRRERYAGRCSRSFYVGDALQPVSYTHLRGARRIPQMRRYDWRYAVRSRGRARGRNGVSRRGLRLRSPRRADRRGLSRRGCFPRRPEVIPLFMKSYIFL